MLQGRCVTCSCGYVRMHYDQAAGIRRGRVLFVGGRAVVGDSVMNVEHGWARTLRLPRSRCTQPGCKS